MEVENSNPKVTNKHTVIVKGIPYEWTDTDLYTHFNTVTPIKRAFIIYTKSSKSLGYGFVQYNNIEDMYTGMEKLNKSKVIGKDKYSILIVEEAGSDHSAHTNNTNIKKRKRDDSKPKEAQKKKIQKNTTTSFSSLLLIPNIDSNIISQKRLYKRLRKLPGFVKLIHPAPESYNNDNSNLISARVLFDCEDTAKKAFDKINNHHIKEFILKPIRLSSKSARIVIHNLPFKVTIDLLKKEFSHFGQIIDVVIPTSKTSNSDTTPNNRIIGVGFIQYATAQQACDAIEGGNGIKMLGKELSVDWALDKTIYEKKRISLQNKDVNINTNQINIGDSEEENKNANTDDASFSEEEKSTNESDFHETKENKPKKKQYKSEDANENLTIFIRNLSPSTTGEDLKKYFEQFGRTSFAVITKGVTGESLCTGFVKFQTKESVDAVLNLAGSTSNFTSALVSSKLELDNRPLFCCLALSRSGIKELKANRSKNEDKKRMNLLTEGLVFTNNDYNFSSSEIEIREELYSRMKTKLKNPNFTVSNVRLSLHKIPISTSESELKEFFKKHGSIKQVKIVKYDDRFTDDGKKLSKKYGFIEYSRPEDAIKAVQDLNSYRSKFKGMIVCFAIDDQRKLFIRKQKQTKIKPKKTKH